MFRELINTIPFNLLVILLMLLFMCITYIFSRISTPWFHISADTEHVKLTNTLMGILASGFFVLLAFIIINTWNYQQEARNAASKEAYYLAVMLRNIAAFPPKYQQELKQSIINYTVHVRVDEWNSMRHGQESPAAWKSLDKLYTQIQNLPASTYQDQLYHSLVTTNVNNILMSRRDRLSKIDSIIPKTLINTVFAYSIFLAMIVGLIRGKDNIINLTPILLFSGLLGLNLALALNFDYPYSGEINVTNIDYYKGALSEFPDKTTD
ncbi:DUF4239 domain-containing protein [Legionella bononiensis]|uniref:DUF4239 domain-containing protein n=1 Tax=Legionella bononiensis TaxID=2793102 RepID=A0ABS1WA30_9GAMM|nr:DUF4239 domain-containing protein [Legionella bononiensis]MBL7480545.1 DUF4239 domain-containing protein [Legionella bononiensis]MBL7526216.1 DUF4239 domain-containing protein [Legionella bononiensis]MBL7563289.1 DUF4239 domain-containing protein [Legionella bononiensis]